MLIVGILFFLNRKFALYWTNVIIGMLYPAYQSFKSLENN